MAMVLVYEVEYFVAYHRQFWNWSTETRHHVEISARIHKSLQQYAKDFYAIAHSPLLTLKHVWDTKGFGQQRNVVLLKVELGFTFDAVLVFEVEFFVVLVGKQHISGGIPIV